MSRTGTRKQNIRSSRKKGGVLDRVTAIAKRAGFVGGIIVFVLWLGVWLYLSGTAQRGAQWSEQKVYELAATQGFAVQEILLEGREHTDADVLRALINVERGDPIFNFKPREAKDLIERISWVKEAHVERRLPHTVYIGILERKPIALWQNKGKVRLIDSEGTTITDVMRSDFKDLVLIVGQNAPEHAPQFLQLLEAEPLVRDRVEAATWVGDRRWDLKMHSGVDINLPEKDIGFALRRLATAQDEDGLLDKDLKSIDVREEARIIIRTNPGGVREYKASYQSSGKPGDNI